MSGQAMPMTNGTAAPFNWGKFFSLDNKWIAPMFITTILVVGNLSFGMLESYKKTGIAIVASLITELILSKIYFGKWPILASAYISGISVGILVRSPAVWPYFVCAVVSIMSKYVLRVNNRHIWNPSNFGIAVLVFLAPETVATLSIQWGNYLLPMIVIWVFGLGDYCAAEAISYHGDVCGVFYCAGVCAELDYGKPVAIGSGAVDGADVSAVYIFYDYGSEDDGEVEEVAVRLWWRSWRSWR